MDEFQQQPGESPKECLARLEAIDQSTLPPAQKGACESALAEVRRHIKEQKTPHARVATRQE